MEPAAEIVGAARSMGDLGVCFGANLFQRGRHLCGSGREYPLAPNQARICVLRESRLRLNLKQRRAALTWWRRQHRDSLTNLREISSWPLPDGLCDGSFPAELFRTDRSYHRLVFVYRPFGVLILIAVPCGQGATKPIRGSGGELMHCFRRRRAPWALIGPLTVNGWLLPCGSIWRVDPQG